MRRALPALACALVLLGCQVDSDYLEDVLYHCEGPADCGEGWGCVRASPYAADFCAPDCEEDSGCDGICTVQNDRALCLRGCRFREDGTASSCSEGYECVRTSVETDEGVCYPVQTCRSSAECASEEICLSELVGLGPEDPDSAGFYCVPTPDETGSCGLRSTPVSLGAGSQLCLATCDPPDTRCPPGFGCLLQSAILAEEDDDVLCFPGLYGVPCDDDTNCIFGSCRDTGGAGRQCTLTCEEAGLLAGGCGDLFSLGTVIGALELECEPEANGGEGGGLCVVRSDIGFVCTTPESDAYRCAEGLECRTFPTSDGSIKLCTKTCRIDQQCNEPGSSEHYCVDGLAGPGFCFPRAPDGSDCTEDRECVSGTCREGTCAGSPT